MFAGRLARPLACAHDKARRGRTPAGFELQLTLFADPDAAVANAGAGLDRLQLPAAVVVIRRGIVVVIGPAEAEGEARSEVADMPPAAPVSALPVAAARDEALAAALAEALPAGRGPAARPHVA